MPNPASYYQDCYKGQVFTASIDGVTTSVAANSTYTGLCIANPTGSGVKAVIGKVGVGFKVAFAAASTVGLMVGSNSTAVTLSNTVTPVCLNVSANSLTPKVKAAFIATLPGVPVLATVFGVGLTGAITTTGGGLNFVDLQDSIILQPGAFAALYTSTASGTNSTACSIMWTEAVN